MQLQRSLFSFYKVFIRKTPLCIWIALSVVFMGIIMWQIVQVNNQQPAYNFDKCFLEYYNATRGASNDTQKSSQSNKQEQQQSSLEVQIDQKQQQTQKQAQAQTQKQTQKFQVPFFLKASYYLFLNETTTVKIYLSDQIKYKQGESNCRIVLNTQKIHAKEDKQEQNAQQQSAINFKQQQKAITILQQIQIQEVKDNQEQTSRQKQLQQLEYKQEYEKPASVENYNEISNQQKIFLNAEHPYMHLTANPHVVYLDGGNQFQQRHGIQTHAIILSRQQLKLYPQTLFGVSSKLWRFHGNEQIEQNSYTLRSITESFKRAANQITRYYFGAIQKVNELIKQQESINANKNSTIGNNGIGNAGNAGNAGNVSNQTKTPNQNQKTQQQHTTQKNQSNTKQQTIIVPTPKTMILLQNISPLDRIKVYFHYPQIIRVEDLFKLISSTNIETGVFFTLFFLTIVGIQMLFISGIVGLLVRYLFFLIATVYLFLGGCFINKQWGWVYKYFNLVRNRSTNAENNISCISSAKIIAMFAFALLGMLMIFTVGSKFVLQNLYIYAMPFSETFYAEMLLKNMFVIELFYYICCRSRLTLRFFPYLSLQISLLVLFLNVKFYFYNISWLVNLHMWAHILLMFIFSALENIIGSSKFYNQFTPSLDKPRALYYIGYDISWQNTLPPIWTYFTTYFDLKYFDQKQKSLIDRDYQLLYGRLMGMNQRQQLPEDQDQENDEQIHKLNQNLSQSNQMSLIR